MSQPGFKLPKPKSVAIALYALLPSCMAFKLSITRNMMKEVAMSNGATLVSRFGEGSSKITDTAVLMRGRSSSTGVTQRIGEILSATDKSSREISFEIEIDSALDERSLLK
jgi:hypothetical protein